MISGTRHSIGNGQVFQVITDVSGDSSPQIIQLNFIYMLLFCNVKSAIEKRKLTKGSGLGVAGSGKETLRVLWEVSQQPVPLVA